MAVYSSDDDLLTKALKLLADDQKAQQTQSDFKILQQAAEELGIPKSYLLKAKKRLEDERQKALKRRKTIIFSLLFFVFLGLPLMVWLVESNPWVDHFDEATHWELSTQPQTVARYEHLKDEEHGGYARIHIESIQPDAQGHFAVSLSNAQVPNMIISYHDITFTARSKGLSKIILAFEGPNHTWVRSEPISLSPNWYSYKVLRADLQSGTLIAGVWKPLPMPLETGIQRIHFIFNEKTGTPTEKGHLDLDRVLLDVLHIN